MIEYQPGDIVRVTHHIIEVLRAVDDPKLGRILVGVARMKDGSRREGSVFLDAPDTVVELVARATPGGWPPRQKDLWRDRTGEVWFAIDRSDPNVTDEPDIAFVPSFDADGYDPGRVLETGAPLILVHREDDAS
ncbi:hypothetical protein [Streptomyces albidoflavus]|uniref:hypothetical protein n=1 Tax=Streptomyces albidoflavus TaxID=1886 RepID=UPI0033340A54